MATSLQEKNVGSIVTLKENGNPVTFRLVHKGNPNNSIYPDEFNDVGWLVRSNAYKVIAFCADDVIMSGGKRVYSVNYAKSLIDADLTSAYFRTLDSSVQSVAVGVRVPYWDGDSISGTVRKGANGLYRKVFILGASEVGFTSKAIASYFGTGANYFKNMPVDGAKLDYFEETCNDSTTRITTQDDGSPVLLATRSNGGVIYTYDQTNAFVMEANANGGIDGRLAYFEQGVRPVICLPLSTVFTDDGTLALPPTAPASLSVSSLPLRGGESATVSWSASTDPNNDLAGYELEQRNGSGSFSRIYHGTATNASITVPFGVSTIQFRVRALDSAGNYSGYTSTSSYSITNQNRPTTPSEITVSEMIMGGGLNNNYMERVD